MNINRCVHGKLLVYEKGGIVSCLFRLQEGN